ncbi:MAG: hypothetical protein CL608_29620 [Anaerolineaceae bacterium]|nr:hypothetical protein [Anaerolineaceae bacterium]
MWWIISLIGLVLFAMEAVVTTFFLLVALNGFPSLPNALVAIYVVSGCASVLGLSFLAGWLAKKLAQSGSLPLWFAGVLTTMGSLVLLPIVLAVWTFTLLLMFGLL